MRTYFFDKKQAWRAAAFLLVLLLIAGVYGYKQFSNPSLVPKTASLRGDSNNKLPTLVDLGGATCIYCQQMIPILEELKKEYAGRVNIKVIDISDNPDEATKYGIRVIPTQILFDSNGNEIERHEGFIAKEDLIKAFELVGVR
jgi:thioredoxin 1